MQATQKATQKRRKAGTRARGLRIPKREVKRSKPMVVKIQKGGVFVTYFPPQSDMVLSRGNPEQNKLGVQFMLLLEKGISSLDAREVRALAGWAAEYVEGEDGPDEALERIAARCPKRIISKVIRGARAVEEGMYGPEFLGGAMQLMERCKDTVGPLIAKQVAFPS